MYTDSGHLVQDRSAAPKSTAVECSAAAFAEEADVDIAAVELPVAAAAAVGWAVIAAVAAPEVCGTGGGSAVAGSTRRRYRSLSKKCNPPGQEVAAVAVNLPDCSITAEVARVHPVDDLASSFLLQKCFGKNKIAAAVRPCSRLRLKH